MRKRGFTLIELLVVVAIIGVLASIVIGSFSGSRERARDAVRISDLQQLSLNMALYRDANGTYPGDLSDLVPTFIPAVPSDPQNNAYSYNSNGSRYVLKTVLEQASNRPNNHLGTAPSGTTMACSGATDYCIGR